jgi:hypothetical protein
MFGIRGKKEEPKRKLKSYKRKSPTEKADELLGRAWYKYLSEHPTVAQEIARQKFGLPDTYDSEEEPTTLSDQIRDLAATNKLLRESFGGDNSQPLLMQIAELLKSLPQVLGGLGALGITAQQQPPSHEPQQTIQQLPPQLRALLQPQLNQPPFRQPEPEPRIHPPVKQQPKVEQEQQHQEQEAEEHLQNKLRVMLEELLSMEPEAAARYLSEFQDKPEDIRGTIYQQLIGNDVDSIVGLLPLLKNAPQYQFLSEFFSTVESSEFRIWLAELLDSISSLEDSVSNS